MRRRGSTKSLGLAWTHGNGEPIGARELHAAPGRGDETGSEGLGKFPCREGPLVARACDLPLDGVRGAALALVDVDGPDVDVVTRIVAKLRHGCRPGEPQIWITQTPAAVSYTHLRAHETDSYLVCRLLLEKQKKR